MCASERGCAFETTPNLHTDVESIGQEFFSGIYDEYIIVFAVYVCLCQLLFMNSGRLFSNGVRNRRYDATEEFRPE